ncbi:hypothetical protein EUA93_02245 [Nocardioides oleivorans]|uniref:Uncharacterized protein n=1 Tax=Nocardioides oleivorans TaxID=273676 RepID=A0A4Q2RWE6_9ACTN|nr:hypothetical protein [Nocardioides oleivorans]RYB93278.1 hypothetical protein EUA93_02245 [Nocardioides oleivorans]
MLSADIGLVTNAMTALKAPPDLIEQVVTLLNSNSEGLAGQVVDSVNASWFGGSTNAHRIGVNAAMAHQATVDEFQKLADSLRQYGEAIDLWAEEVRDVDGLTTAEMIQRQTALSQVNTTLDDARDQSATPDMGNGDYEPPATDGGA